MGRALGALGLLGVVAAGAALAGCGSDNAPYTAEKTRPCLQELGYTVQRAPEVDLITSTAANGGLVARAFGNTLTIAFGADARDGLRLARAYRSVAPRRLRELIGPKRNAVLVWTISPSFAQMEAAEKCLR